MLRPRFRVRWLMIGVAVAAILVWSLILTKRVVDYRRRAAEYRSSEELCTMFVASGDRTLRQLEWQLKGLGDEPGAKEQGENLRRLEIEQRDQTDYARRRLEYYRAMRTKYDRAARAPWASVAVDPPPPD